MRRIDGLVHPRPPCMRACRMRAACMHLHPPYATALVGLADPEIKPIDQNTARYYNRVAYDLGYQRNGRQ